MTSHPSCCASRAKGENGQLTRWNDLPGVELLKADFKRHSYLPHWHDTYTIAIVEAGCERVRLAGAERHVSPGDVVLLNPGDIHDGEAYDPAIGWDFRVIYVSSSVLLGNTKEADGDRLPGIAFHGGVLHHPELWRTLLAMHQTLSSPNTLLNRTSTLFSSLAKLAEHVVPSPKKAGAALISSSLDRARQFLDAHWADSISLEALAEVAGLSRFHLLREFKRSYGLPPHAYQLQLRVLRAKAMLFQGAPARAVALEAGFYDQAHLSNVMKRYVGVSPGRMSQH